MLSNPVYNTVTMPVDVYDALRAALLGANKRIAKLEEELRGIAKIKCSCNSYLGPCGCGELAVVLAEEALEPNGVI